MKPIAKYPRDQKVKEIKQLKRKILQKKKQLNEERKKYQRSSKDKQRRLDIHEYDMQDLIEDQQRFLEQVKHIGMKHYSLLNRIVYDLSVQKQMQTQNMMDQNVNVQNSKRERPFHEKQNQANELRIGDPIKRTKRNEENEDIKIVENIVPVQQQQVKMPENQPQKLQQQIKPLIQEKQLIVQKEQQDKKVRTEQQLEQIILTNQNPKPQEQEKSCQQQKQKDKQQKIEIKQPAPQQSVDPIEDWCKRVITSLSQQLKRQRQILNNPQPNQENHEQNHQNLQQKDNKFNHNNHITDQDKLFVQFPLDYPKHPKGYVNSFSSHTHFRYGIIQADDIYGVFKQINLQIPKKAHFLNHYQVPFKIDEFLKYDWSNCIGFGLVASNFTNQDFKKLSQNVHLYPALKIMKLSYNSQLTNVTAEMLSKFKKLQYIHFGVEKSKCNLSAKSIEELKNYKKSHPYVLIKCINGTSVQIN